MVDSSHAMHDDFRGHTGGCLSWGIGSPISISQKQKLNSRSSTESEIIGVDDVMDKILWTKLFLQAQGVQVQEKYCIKITKVPLSWKPMANGHQEKEHVQLILGIPL